MPVTNPFSIGQANIYLDETFDVDDKWVPGEEKQKEVAFGNDGDVDVVIRARFTPELILKNGTKAVSYTHLFKGESDRYSESLLRVFFY